MLDYFSKLNSLQKRVVSAAVLAPIVLLVVFAGGVLFNVFVLVVAIVMAFEWNDIVNHDDQKLRRNELRRWRLAGIVYVSVFASSLYYLMGSNEGGHGALTILLMVLIVWATDTAAYFVGRFVGGVKLMPSVSPNKTWSGAIGGVVAAMIVGGFAAPAVAYNFWQMLFLSIFLSLLSQMGDLLESWIKRQFRVKDSGYLIPGHGGVMDRIDGFVVVAPAFAVVTMVTGGSIF